MERVWGDEEGLARGKVFEVWLYLRIIRWVALGKAIEQVIGRVSV